MIRWVLFKLFEYSFLERVLIKQYHFSEFFCSLILSVYYKWYNIPVKTSVFCAVGLNIHGYLYCCVCL